jgi:hypothetical protein
MSYEYFVGFNSESLVDMVSENSILELYDAQEWTEDLEERWLDEGYGFLIPTHFENSNEELLYEFESEVEIDEDDFFDADDYFNTASDGEIEVKSSHPNISKMLRILKDLNTSFYDENQDLIESDEIENKVKTTDDFVLFICELETP